MNYILSLEDTYLMWLRVRSNTFEVNENPIKMDGLWSSATVVYTEAIMSDKDVLYTVMLNVTEPWLPQYSSSQSHQI